MSKNNAVNLDITNNADGFDVSGGTTKRKITVTGADITLTGSGSNTYSFPTSTDTLVGRASTDTLTNKTIDANGAGNTISNIEVADMAASAVVTESETIASNDNDMTIPTSAAVKDYVDTGYRLRGIIKYESGTSQTYTPTAGTRAIYVEAVGGGGAGGSADGGSSQAGAGSGASGAGYCAKWITSVAASYTYTVGAGGTPGAAGNNPGGDGNDTTFTDGGSVNMVAIKGYGGAGSGAAGTTQSIVGGAGVTNPTGGDINMAGNSGGFSLRESGTVAVSGYGGASGNGFGGGGQARGSSGAGLDGGTYGGGGSGAVALTTTDRAGGAGGSGVLIIREYI